MKISTDSYFLRGIVLVLAILPLLNSRAESDHPGECGRLTSLPAHLGPIPTCAQPGQTYCESVDNYPSLLILELLDRGDFKCPELLRDEATDCLGIVAPQTPHEAPSPAFSESSPLQFSLLPQASVAKLQGVQGAPSDFGELHGADFTSKNGEGRVTPDPKGDQPAGPTSYYNHDEWWSQYSLSSRRAQDDSSVTFTLCPSRYKFVMPKMALNIKGEWMYVVNLQEIDKNYTQLVGVRICISERCNKFFSLPNGYTSKCEHYYVQRRLIALKEDGSELIMDIFWLPSSCLCEIRSVSKN